MPETIIIAFISMLGAVLVALIGNNYFRRRVSDPGQEKLIKTLQDLVRAQDEKIEHLQETVDGGNIEIQGLRQQIEELRAVIVTQAIMIEELTKSNFAP